MLGISKKIVVLLAILFLIISGVFVIASPTKKAKLDIIAKAYGSSPDSDNWNPDSDLNNDGFVNIFDLALASKNNAKKTKSAYTSFQESSTIISVEPNETIVGSRRENFIIDINITDAQDTYAWHFRLNWNASVLNIIDITEGTFLSQGVPDTTFIAYDIHYDEGWALVGNTFLGEPASYPTGNGTLAIINFNALDNVQFLENSTLHLNETVLFLGDGETEYSHITEDGYCIVCLGDTDRDSDIDYDDFIVLAGAYGTVIGQPAYRPEADFDGDDNIDYDDFILLAGNYGRSC